MPPFVRGLIALFVVVPSAMMWVFGILVAGGAVVGELFDPRHGGSLPLFGIGVTAAVLGFAMVLAHEIFAHGNVQGMAPSRLPALVALGSSVQLLGVIGLCAFVVVSTKPLLGQETHGLTIVLPVSLAVLAASFFLHRLASRLKTKWKSEYWINMDASRSAER